MSTKNNKNDYFFFNNYVARGGGGGVPGCGVLYNLYRILLV
jgi:hypothetical protein